MTIFLCNVAHCLMEKYYRAMRVFTKWIGKMQPIEKNCFYRMLMSTKLFSIFLNACASSGLVSQHLL